jgi:hypothetical protein
MAELQAAIEGQTAEAADLQRWSTELAPYGSGSIGNHEVRSDSCMMHLKFLMTRHNLRLRIGQVSLSGTASAASPYF